MYVIAVVGPGGVGKSALCVRLVSGSFVERYDPTIEDTYRAMVHLDGMRESVTLELWDTAGQAEYMSGLLWALRKCDGYVAVVSCTERSTVDTYMRVHAPAVRRFVTADELPHVVVVNKTDIAPEFHVVDAEYVVHCNMARSIDDVVSVSVLNGTGVHEVFAKLVVRIDAHRRAGMRSTPSGDSVNSPRSIASISPRTPRGCDII